MPAVMLDPQGEWYVGDEPVAHPQQGRIKSPQGAPEDGAHADLPGAAHAGHHHEGEEGVQAHGGVPGRWADWPAGPSGCCRMPAMRQVVTNTACVSMPAAERICG